MSHLFFYAFAIWFLALPFTVISSISLGMTAIDKLMAPLLIVFWFGLLMIGRYRFDNKKLSFIFLAFAFFLVRNVSKIDDSTLYASLLWEDIILFGYFSLPILYIENLSNIRTASKVISINAIVGCVSAFLVAFGLLTLPYERFSQSRIGFLDIQKSIGLFSSYGDLAQFSAYFLLLALFVPTSLTFGNKKYAGKLPGIFAMVVVILGLISNQSRSFLLSLIAAIFMALIFRYRSYKPANKMLFNMLLLATGISFAAIIAYLFADLVSVLSSLGGAQAQGTAMSRLEQYQYAYGLIKEYPLFGVDAAYYSKHAENIHGIHNMWLGQLARGGIASVGVLGGLLFMMFRASLKLLDNPLGKQHGIAAIGYMFAVLVSTLFYPAGSSLFWALLGMNTAIITTSRSSGQPDEHF
jgi:O-antigen ligase